MDKNKLINLVNDNYSTYDISSELGKSQTTIRYWLKKYKIKTKLPFYRGGNKKKWLVNSKLTCSLCKDNKPLSNFYPKRTSNGYHTYCKECLSKLIIKRQRDFKIKCVEYKGGKCYCCGYKKYLGALEFHHINPKHKDFVISRTSRVSFNDKIKKELDKCILVCSNCHKEIHGGLINIK